MLCVRNGLFYLIISTLGFAYYYLDFIAQKLWHRKVQNNVQNYELTESLSQDSDPLVCLQSMYSLRRWGHDFKITHDKLAKYKIKKKNQELGQWNRRPWRHLEIFIARLLTMIRNWTEPKCLSIKGWWNKICFIPSMEYYAVVIKRCGVCIIELWV